MDIIIIIILLIAINFFVARVVSSNFTIEANYVWLLLGVHFSLTIVYMISASLSASDSVAYFNKSAITDDWFTLFDTGTSFITFLGWIFSHLIGLSYYSVMLIFSYLGYIAVLLLYVSAKENLFLHPVWQGLSYIEIVFLLPNLHYWSSSLGKGSVILLGIGLAVYGLSRFNRRIIPLVLGSFIIYMVRPHMLLTFLLSIILGVFLTSSGIKWYLKWALFIVAVFIFYALSDSVIEFAEADSLNFLDSETLAHRTAELGKAGSGVDIQNYNLAMKLFTFWFRPLFVDGLSGVGLIASFENLFNIYMAFIIITELPRNWSKVNGWFKICLLFFLLGSFILSQVSGNLGIAMRQKAQVMPFMFLLFCKVMSYRHRSSQEYSVSVI